LDVHHKPNLFVGRRRHLATDSSMEGFGEQLRALIR
jgi:hypothetical protein